MSTQVSITWNFEGGQFLQTELEDVSASTLLELGALISGVVHLQYVYSGVSKNYPVSIDWHYDLRLGEIPHKSRKRVLILFGRIKAHLTQRPDSLGVTAPKYFNKGVDWKFWLEASEVVLDWVIFKEGGSTRMYVQLLPGLRFNVTPYAVELPGHCGLYELNFLAETLPVRALLETEAGRMLGAACSCTCAICNAAKKKYYAPKMIVTE